MPTLIDRPTVDDRHGRHDRSAGPRPASRPRWRAAGAAAAGLAGLLAAGGAPAPAGAVPAPASAPAGAAAGKSATAPARAMDCSRPTDGRIVHAVDMVDRAGGDEGDVQLWYSPACRSVQAIAISRFQTCGDVQHIKAYVVHNGVVTGSGTCQSGRKAATPWVYDGGIQQAAKGQIVLTGGFVYATGTTPAY